MPDDYNPPQQPDWDQTTDYGRHWREYVEPPPRKRGGKTGDITGPYQRIPGPDDSLLKD